MFVNVFGLRSRILIGRQIGLENKSKDTEEITETVEVTEEVDEEEQIQQEVSLYA